MLCLAFSVAFFISALAALTCALGLIQEKPAAYRAIMLANGLIWSVYDLNVGAYTMILSQAATEISALIGIIRIDLKREKNVAEDSLENGKK